MAKESIFASAGQLIRYYQAGLVNTAVGTGLVVLFLLAGMNVFLAQFLAHTLGVAFNYFTYSRYTFRENSGSKMRFVLAYIGNYLLGVAILAAILQFVPNPYIAGFATVGIVSVINYLILKRMVFIRPKAA